MELLTKTEALYRTMHNAEPRYQQNNQGILFLRYWLDRLPDPPARIVEIGCGNGKLSDLLSIMQYDVTGVDVVGGPYERQGYSFVKHDITETPWAFAPMDSAFDICVSFDVLEHLAEQDVDKVLLEMRRASEHLVLSIACHSPDRLHLTVRPPQWWHGKLTALYEGLTDFKVLTSDLHGGQTLIFYGRKEE